MTRERETVAAAASGPASGSAAGRRTWRFVGLRWKLLLGFTLVFSLLTGGIFYWFYQFSSERALKRVHDDLVRTLVGAVGGVDVDQLLDLVGGVAG